MELFVTNRGQSYTSCICIELYMYSCTNTVSFTIYLFLQIRRGGGRKSRWRAGLCVLFRAGHFRYFVIFSLIKNDFLHFLSS